MKKTLKDTGAEENVKVDYLHLIRTSEPIESFGVKEFHKLIEEERKKKARKSAKNK